MSLSAKNDNKQYKVKEFPPHKQPTNFPLKNPVLTIQNTPRTAKNPQKTNTTSNSKHSTLINDTSPPISSYFHKGHEQPTPSSPKPIDKHILFQIHCTATPMSPFTCAKPRARGGLMGKLASRDFLPLD